MTKQNERPESPADAKASFHPNDVAERMNAAQEKLNEFLASIETVDAARFINLIRANIWERLNDVEGRIVRHERFGRLEEANKYSRFRSFYARTLEASDAATTLLMFGLALPEILADFANDGALQALKEIVELSTNNDDSKPETVFQAIVARANEAIAGLEPIREVETQTAIIRDGDLTEDLASVAREAAKRAANPSDPQRTTVQVFPDGNQFCAVRPGFVNLQESIAGFGDTEADAVASLINAERVASSTNAARNLPPGV